MATASRRVLDAPDPDPFRLRTAAPRAAPEPAPKPRRRPATFPAIAPTPPSLAAFAATRALAVGDWAILAIAATLAGRWGFAAAPAAWSLAEAGPILAVLAPLKLGLWAAAAYDSRPRPSRAEIALGGVTLGAVLAFAAAAAAAPTAKAAATLSAIAPLAAAAIALHHTLWAAWMRRCAHRAPPLAALAGATPAAIRALERMTADARLRLVAAAADRRPRTAATLAGAPVCGDLEDLRDWRDQGALDRIIVAVDALDDAGSTQRLERMAWAARRADILVDFTGAPGVAPRHALAFLPAQGPGAGALFAKRAFDIGVSAAALAALAPILVLAAAAIRMESRGPALAKIHRRAIDGRVVTLHRFRTHFAAPGAPETRPANDGARTFMGVALDALGLSSAPMLADVLRGEASLVGPAAAPLGGWRDCIAARTVAQDYARRFGVRAGLVALVPAGWSATPEALLCADMRYMAHASVWVDLYALARAALRPRRRTG
ncbi:MAG: sugar transferase [Hyphomonadaceae bacterium]|nr:sugar transferase [Hyphomonadaceae bacterium]